MFFLFLAKANGAPIMISSIYWGFLLVPFQIFHRRFCFLAPSLRPPTMPSISLLSSCGLAVAHLCYFVFTWLRSFSSLSLLYNAMNALAFVPGAGVRGMKGAQAECSIHPNTHLWQTPGPHDSPRRPALQRERALLLMTAWVEFIH